MATVTRELIYRCADDCQMSGCPGHDGRLDYQSVSDSYTFTMNGRELFFERGELDAMIDLLVNVDRADAANAEALSRAPIAEGGGDVLPVLRDVLALLKNTKELQGREHVSLGIRFNAAIESLSRQGGEYDRELIAEMLEEYASDTRATFFDTAIAEQITLLRAADNREAAGVHTGRASDADEPSDTAMLDWLANPDNPIGNVQLPTVVVMNNMDSLRGAIREAMRLDPEIAAAIAAAPAPGGGE